MLRRARALLVGLCLVAAHAHARAQVPDGRKARTDVGAFPLLGGDSDLGFGGGVLVSVARIDPAYQPYLYRVFVGAMFTFKPTPAGWQAPYQDVYVELTLPHVLPRRMRLELRPSYTHESNQRYYGIGNAAPAPAHGPHGQSPYQYFEYGRTHPTLLLRLRLRLGRGFFLGLGDALTYNRIDVHPDSKLASDLTSGDPTIREFFEHPRRQHLVNFFEYTLLYDTRDNETSPRHGMYHELRLRLSPGGTPLLPYRYAQVNLTARFYVTLPHTAFWTLAVRVVSDSMFGQPPFYELARFEDTFALGGVKGVRGVPGQRYYGKIKLFGNLESRFSLAKFGLFGQPARLGAAAFIDLGRLWSDWSPNPALDGRGLGLKFGVGGGVRLQQGSAFVVRADIAWSPDANPIGLYVAAGQIF